MAPLGKGEAGFDFGEGDPGGLGDFVDLFMDGGVWLGKLGEEEHDFFLDIEAGDVIGKAVAGGGVDDDVEVGFFFDFAESGFDFGFAGLGVAFGEAGEAVLLRNEEDVTIMDDNSAAGFFGKGVGMRVGKRRVERLGRGVAGDIEARSGMVHGYII